MAYNAMMEFIETPIFTREIKKLLPDEDYHQLQIMLLLPYKKAAREDLTASQLKELRKLVKEVLK